MPRETDEVDRLHTPSDARDILLASMPNVAGFGLAKEAEYFSSTYPNAPATLDRLYDTCEKAFIRKGGSDQPGVRLGFFLGRTCVEEFSELSLLAINGYGIGALKLLRHMYERAVHAAYLLKHPELADLFLNYNTVHKRKAHNHLKHIFRATNVLSEEDARKLEDEYNAIKADYTVGSTGRIRGSWNKEDLVSMANDVGEVYGELYYDCYYKPTLQTHTTVVALESRMMVSDDGVLTSKDGPQREEARMALIHGHNLLLKVLETQNEYFGLGLESELMERKKDLLTAY